MAVKCCMSERKTLTLKTASRLLPAAVRTAERLRMHWCCSERRVRVWSLVMVMGWDGK